MNTLPNTFVTVESTSLEEGQVISAQPADGIDVDAASQPDGVIGDNDSSNRGPSLPDVGLADHGGDAAERTPRVPEPANCTEGEAPHDNMPDVEGDVDSIRAQVGTSAEAASSAEESVSLVPPDPDEAHVEDFEVPEDFGTALIPDDGEQDDVALAENVSPIDYVYAFFAERELQVGYDDSLTQRGKPLTALTRDMVTSVLAVRPITLSDVSDMMVIDCKQKENNLKAGELRAALRQVSGQMKHARRNAIITPLLEELPLELADKAADEWRKMHVLFEPMADLPASVIIMHFMWQVKSKVLGRVIDHHLMPIITSSMQGSGKTTFVRSLLAPLHELVTGASLLSDFSDRRTLGLFRYLVAVLDDMEVISEKQVPVLKSIITGDDIHRRQLGSSMDAKVRQMSTPIGTSNQRIEELVPDDTGHRRFVTLLFRNGAIARGGSSEIWETVSSLNYELMWKSVNPFEPSPLAGHLVALTQYQAMATAPGSLIQFLIELDLDHPDVRSIAYRNQGVQAQGLHDLYEARTGKQLTKQAFAKEMFACMKNSKVPFGDKHRLGEMRVYRYRYPLINGLGAKTTTTPSAAPSEATVETQVPPAQEDN